MTDTTDIKALLEKLNAQTNSYDTVIIRDFEAKQLVAAFEAELQRAEALQGQLDYRNEVLTRAIRQREAAEAELAAMKPEINWPAAQKVRAALDRAACPDAFMRIAVEACTEALKGEQVPVAWTSQRSLETKNKIVAFTDDISALDYGVANGWTDIVELFTAPQNPVVLLPPAYEKSADFTEYHQGWNACRNYMLAEAKEVGGILKDGE